MKMTPQMNLQKKQKNSFLRTLVISSSFVAAFFVFIVSPVFAQDLSGAVGVRRAQLEAELEQLEEEIAGFQSIVNTKQNEAVSLERDIAILDAQIKKTQLQIQSLQTLINKLTFEIRSKETSIDNIGETIEKQKQSLGASLRKLREYDDISIIEAMLANEQLSDFFGDVDSFDVVQNALHEQFAELRSFREEEATLREQFIVERQEQTEARGLLVLERSALEERENERQAILRETRGVEELYRQYVQNKQQDAATIRSQLFLLQGSPAISFEEALRYAERAQKQTGIRPAFLLGLIEQESRIGANIGQCNLPEDPPQYKWSQIMKPSRDIQPYLDITERLGLDPNLMPLSCPQAGGWGGAMGPAQFIPSTWALYEDRIARMTGHNPPNPWDPEDAFMASALFLTDLGADSIAGEREAAGRYFAGYRWDGALGRAYSNQVLERAYKYQQQVDFLASL